MKKYIYAIVNGSQYVLELDELVSRSWEENACIKCIIPLEVKGETYKERSADLEQKAKDYQSSYAECTEGSLSMTELLIINNFFEDNGRRYGLLKEFKENAVC